MSASPSLGVLVLITSLSAAAALAGTPAEVIGEDNRKDMPSEGLPWSAIGKLTTPTGNCTATLVAANLVVTAAHCVVSEETGEIEPSFFQAGVQDGRPLAVSESSWTWIGSRMANPPRYADWAIIRLKDPLGNQFGKVAVEQWSVKSASAAAGRAALAGYSHDYKSGRSASMHEGCSILGMRDGAWLHDCDATTGESGAPILVSGKDGAYRLIGVHSGFDIAHDDYNTAAPAQNFIATLRSAR